MRSALTIAAVLAAAATGARAQDPHAGHMAPSASPHASHGMPAPPAPKPDPHAGHVAPPEPAQPAEPHSGHGAPAASDSPHAHHEAAPPSAPQADPPPIPTDHDADRYFPKAEMTAARAQLAREHGRISWSKVMLEKLEYQPGAGADAYAWDGSASFGGDIDRLVLKSRGEGDRKLERAEVEALWSRAVSPWFNFELGARQDLQHGGRTYAVAGLDGLAPYEFDLDAALYLSSHGDLSARVEAAHDFRLTQRLILQPRAEANLAADDAPSQQVGSGLSRVELGLRLRYALIPEVAPYVGVEYERAFGRTARFVRTAGDDPETTRAVLGLRAWF